MGVMKDDESHPDASCISCCSISFAPRPPCLACKQAAQERQRANELEVLLRSALDKEARQTSASCAAAHVECAHVARHSPASCSGRARGSCSGSVRSALGNAGNTGSRQDAQAETRHGVGAGTGLPVDAAQGGEGREARQGTRGVGKAAGESECSATGAGVWWTAEDGGGAALQGRGQEAGREDGSGCCSGMSLSLSESGGGSFSDMGCRPRISEGAHDTTQRSRRGLVDGDAPAAWHGTLAQTSKTGMAYDVEVRFAVKVGVGGCRWGPRERGGRRVIDAPDRDDAWQGGKAVVAWLTRLGLTRVRECWRAHRRRQTTTEEALAATAARARRKSASRSLSLQELAVRP